MKYLCNLLLSPCSTPTEDIHITYIGAVNILESSADLVNEILEMGISQRLTRPNNLMQISFHQLLNEIPLKTNHLDHDNNMKERILTTH